MGRYELVQSCWPTGSLRAADVAALLTLLRRACGVSGFEVAGRELAEITPEALDAVLRRALAEAPFPGAGADENVFGRLGTSEEYLRIDLHSGTSPGQPFIDQYNVDFGGSGLCIAVDDFKQSVSIIRPFEAFVAELNNEVVLDAYTRQQRIGLFKAPAIIRNLHYFDERLASQVGGVEHCLGAPASKVERFLDGVLIELVDEPFDDMNADHLEVQRAVMRYLGLPASPAQAGAPASRQQ